jgi:hypothetical protein
MGFFRKKAHYPARGTTLLRRIICGFQSRELYYTIFPQAAQGKSSIFFWQEFLFRRASRHVR